MHCGELERLWNILKGAVLSVFEDELKSNLLQIDSLSLRYRNQLLEKLSDKMPRADNEIKGRLALVTGASGG